MASIDINVETREGISISISRSFFDRDGPSDMDLAIEVRRLARIMEKAFRELV